MLSRYKGFNQKTWKCLAVNVLARISSVGAANVKPSPRSLNLFVVPFVKVGVENVETEWKAIEH